MSALARQLIFSLMWLLAVTCLPAAETRPPPARDFAAARRHWAYQPIRRPAEPKVKNQRQVLSPIDAFVLQKLEAQALTLSPPADRRTLIRRAYYDLIGLPPTFAEIEAFTKDRSPDAFAKVVDRLLASPHYGERWGRHWLDVARYADTKDLVLLFGKDRLRPYAYTYRDYVIRALNLDTPFDQFVREQIAADQLAPQVEPWRLAALGFLTLGRLYDNNPHDQIDDQIDTVSRGFLGLTIACARCHDHKYDAIPTEDYYSLYGVFASSERPYDLPLIEDPQHVEGGAEFEAKLAEARKKLEEHIDAEYEKLSETARQRVGDYLVRVATTKPDLAETATFYLSLSAEDLRPALVMRWRRYLEERARKDDPVFGLWAEIMELPDEGFGERAREVLMRSSRREEAHLSASSSGSPNLLARAAPTHRTNPLLLAAFQNAVLTNKANVARAYGDLLKGVYESAKKASADAAAARPTADEHELLALLTSRESPFYFPKSQTPHHMSRPEKDKYGGLALELDKLAARATNTPPARAMVVADAPELYEPRVFVRGSPAKPGAPVPRTFLRVLAGDDRKPFAHGSGRLDLANALTAPDNPLTARVIVNRVWMHHFGEPLVNSPSDFGTRSEPPTHPELLDYLAWTFTREGWSLKKLHRLVMQSAVYQQASFVESLNRSTVAPAQHAARANRFNNATIQRYNDLTSHSLRLTTAATRIDPDNKLLWHFHRRRLDLEAMRDTLLFVAGRLNPAMAGRPVDVAGDALNCRRTVYGVVDRQDLPALFRAFDFACPDQSVERRPRTSVPQQALFAMNSPFVMEQAKALAARSEIAGESEPARRVAALYRLVLGRLPTSDEVARAASFVREVESDPLATDEGQLPAWEQFAQALLMTNEMMFVD
ncbi:MAG: DUF1549 domain-containing protein [Verrucomicrobia bacterium]|nr:DUF1549 domain-containing protein [Verrucomicrobiota bacterium]